MRTAPDDGTFDNLPNSASPLQRSGSMVGEERKMLGVYNMIYKIPIFVCVYIRQGAYALGFTYIYISLYIYRF